MDAYAADTQVPWQSSDEARQAVVEQSLLQAFNPYTIFEEEEELPQKRSPVISYTVQQGDTLSEIAYRNGISLKELVEQNKIKNPNFVGIGLKLTMKRNEIIHTVGSGETLDQIAARYQVSESAIAARNPLVRLIPDNLYIGQVLYVPIPLQRRMPAGHEDIAERSSVQVASRGTLRSRTMEWPIENATITSDFGSRWGRMHKGIDLWNENKGNTPILAAKSGTVIEAGTTRAGYGQLVVLDHGDGLNTFYAHMRKILVTVGQEVNQGDVLGYMGNTGDSTNYHLHFEVRQDDTPVNPLRFLR
nr:M23 family metallopeptidase [Brevibacillus massiliensis]